VEQDTEPGLTLGAFLVVFKVGLPNETHWVFWVSGQVSQP